MAASNKQAIDYRFSEIMQIRLRFLIFFLVTSTLLAFADPAAFDLAGPTIEVRVARNGKTLPIAKVPNLMAGDRLWLHPALPKEQSVRYLMVVVFLRGSTNPPPDSWFIKAETWDKKVMEEGIFVNVPADAQQAVIFLAPSTGGDFGAIRGAVHGRPGAFVRASQDLNQASLDRARLDTYLDAVKTINDADPDHLKAATPLLARSLSIKVDQDCLDKVVEQQAPCLTQKQNELVLSDGHTLSVTDALTTGPSSDLAMQLSYTQKAGTGYYSPYISSVIDIAHILESIHTTDFQYIPALSIQHDDTIDLKLNTPPSFHSPKSVIVMSLPAVDKGHLPPLRHVDEKQLYCLQQNKPVLAVEGAPLVFATDYAHDLALRIKGKDGKDVNIPVKPDAAQGGLVADTQGISDADLPVDVTGTLHGLWGFAPYEGPSFHLQNPKTAKWELASADTNALVVGREDTVHLTSGNSVCVESVKAKDAAGKEIATTWKADKSDQIEVKVALKDAAPGALTMVVKQAGAKQPEEISMHSLTEAGKYEGFTLHAGDKEGTLTGNRLDEVDSLMVKGVSFKAGKLSNSAGGDELTMLAQGDVAALPAGYKETARVRLKDGRTLDVPASVVAGRPKVQLLSKSVQSSDDTKATHILLSDTNEVPLNSKIIFSIKAVEPAVFSPSEKIEVATADDVFHTTLSLDNGRMTLQDSKTALGTIDLAKSFGPSAFGPLQFRPVTDNNVTGDWEPLANLVRLPVLDELTCTGRAAPCTLSGTNLFLLDSVASDAQFTQGMQVPDGFAGNVLQVPHPTGPSLYVKLRDNPSIVNTVVLPPKRGSQTQTASIPPAAPPPQTQQQATPPTTPATTKADTPDVAPAKPSPVQAEQPH